MLRLRSAASIVVVVLSAILAEPTHVPTWTTAAPDITNIIPAVPAGARCQTAEPPTSLMFLEPQPLSSAHADLLRYAYNIRFHRYTGGLIFSVKVLRRIYPDSLVAIGLFPGGDGIAQARAVLSRPEKRNGHRISPPQHAALPSRSNADRSRADPRKRPHTKNGSVCTKDRFFARNGQRPVARHTPDKPRGRCA